jgi:hypothetical protein
LKIEGQGFPTVKMGNSDKIEIGEEVAAIGNPKGLEHTISNGIISQKRFEDGDHFLQTTTPISQGSSGGPLVNLKAEVIGITTAVYKEGQNLNFALPINFVKEAIKAPKPKEHFADRAPSQNRPQYSNSRPQLISQSNFVNYRDPNGLFSITAPGNWLLDEWNGWDQDYTTYHYYTMMAPEYAEKASVNGYLSEGIRIHFMFPPDGQYWNTDLEKYSKQFCDDLVNSNEGLVLDKILDTKVEVYPAKIIAFTGNNNQISEQERATFILVCNSNFILNIELVCPKRLINEYLELFVKMTDTFKLGR